MFQGGINVMKENQHSKKQTAYSLCSRLFAGCLLILACLFVPQLSGSPATVWAGTLTGVLNLHQTDADSDYFDVTWDKDINAYGYDVQYSMDSTNWSSSNYTTELSYRFDTLNSGRSYYVRVRSFDKGYWWYTEHPDTDATFSDWCTPVEVVTSPSTISSDDVKQTGGSSSSISVSWEAAEGTTVYKVYYEMGGSWFLSGSTDKTSYTIKGLDPDTHYEVSIAAMRESGSGYETGSYTTYGHDCYTAAGKIKDNVLEKWDSVKNRVTIKWDSASYDNSGYEVYITNLAGKKVKNFKTTETSASFKLSSIKNQGFIFKVRAYKDIDGTSIYGSWSGNKTVIAQPKVTLKRSGKTIKVSWAKIKGASSYAVYRSTSPETGFKKIKTVKSTNLTNKGLSKNKSYYYYVVANNVKVNKKLYKTTTAESREIAGVSYSGQKTFYSYQ